MIILLVMVLLRDAGYTFCILNNKSDWDLVWDPTAPVPDNFWFIYCSFVLLLPPPPENSLLVVLRWLGWMPKPDKPLDSSRDDWLFTMLGFMVEPR